MKILLVTETLCAGGAETFVVRLANRLAERHEVHLLVLHGERIHPGIRAQVSPEVTLHTFHLPLKRLLWKANSALRSLAIDWSPVDHLLRSRLRSLVARVRPDIVHSHLLHADRLTASVQGEGGYEFAHVMTVHGDYAPYLRGLADPQILHLNREVEKVIGEVEAIVGVAQEHVDHFSERFPASRDKLHLIYNGYEPPGGSHTPHSRADLGIPGDRFVFGMVSRGVEQKGWAEAVAAFERLGRQDAVLILVGEGPAIDRLAAGPLPRGVILAGFSANPLEYVQHFDVALLPTRFPHESLPTVVMEYLYCQKPVIVTDVGELADMINDETGYKAGLLLELNDGRLSILNLASLMKQLIENSNQREMMARAASRAFAKFDMAVCARRYADLYESLLSASPIASRRHRPT